jgi:hypothetical protein
LDEDKDKSEDITKDTFDDGYVIVHDRRCWQPPVNNLGIKCLPVCMDKANRIDLQLDPYALQTHFRTRWLVLVDERDLVVPWGDLRCTGWSDSDWSVAESGEETGLSVAAFPIRPLASNRTTLKSLISSSLLLYRIIASFGVPPSTDNGLTLWSYTLLSCEDSTCQLRVRDHKGWPEAHFRGGEKASTEALQLLEWLIGENCPHPYDYTPCGGSA